MSDHAAEFEVRIAARPVTVFALFVNQAAFAKWMGADMGVATIEPEIGGAVRVEYGGGFKIAAGEVVALESPRHFAFTWGYEDAQPFAAGSTRVDITLAEDGAGTLLTLRHTGLPSDVAAREHAGGWRLYTGIIGNMAAHAQYGAGLAERVNAWFEAWGATDAGRRGELLALCMADDGAFHHPMARTTGRDELSGHIASSQRHMQGLVLEPDGAHEQVQEHVRFPWKVTKDGATLASGTNVATLAADGRFATVVGFTNPA
jgi:uncharacterized protein YndB with AHSA1/START domain